MPTAVKMFVFTCMQTSGPRHRSGRRVHGWGPAQGPEGTASYVPPSRPGACRSLGRHPAPARTAGSKLGSGTQLSYQNLEMGGK